MKLVDRGILLALGQNVAECRPVSADRLGLLFGVQNVGWIADPADPGVHCDCADLFYRSLHTLSSVPDPAHRGLPAPRPKTLVPGRASRQWGRGPCSCLTGLAAASVCHRK